MIIKDLGVKINEFLSGGLFSQERLSELIGISRRNLNTMIETNEIKKLETFVSVCRVLQISPDHFLRESLKFSKRSSEDSKPFGNERTLVKLEVEITDSNKELAIKEYLFSALFHTHYNVFFFSSVSLHSVIQRLDYHSIKSFSLPLIYASESQTLNKYNDFKESRVVYLPSTRECEELYFMCIPFKSTDELEANHIYITYNMREGRDYGYLKKDGSEYVFYELDRTDENNLDNKVELYRLKENEIFQIWKVYAVLGINSSGYIGDFELLHDSESLRQIATTYNNK